MCARLQGVSPCSLIPSCPYRNCAGGEHDVVKLALRAPATFPSFLALLFSVHDPAPEALQPWGSTTDCPVLPLTQPQNGLLLLPSLSPH